jgi:hypothetical protein
MNETTNMKPQPAWIIKLKEKWKLKSALQVVLVLLTFICTGTSVLFIKKPFQQLVGINELQGWVKTVIYLLAILPIYNIMLLMYGFIFGQFKFFWEFEKRFFKRLIGRK